MAPLKSIAFLFLVIIIFTSSKPFSLAITPNHYGPPSDFFSSYSPTPSPSPSPVPSQVPNKIKAAYWPSFDSFPISSIDTSYFTHIYYAFLLPEPFTFKLNITQSDQQKLIEFRSGLSAKNPPVKAMLSVGGAGNDPNVFSQMASSKETRSDFIYSTISVARSYEFDGVDLDWELPLTINDMENLGLLYKEWREIIETESKTSGKPPLLLTSAVYYSPDITSYGPARSYPAYEMAQYLDWVSPMCFDYHGKWDKFTGIHSALFEAGSNFSTSFGIGSWIRAGVPPQKLVMGLATYGHTWKLKDPNVNGIGAPTVGIGPGDEDGFFNYYAIIDFNYKYNATIVFDPTRVSYYSSAGDSWIGYDDVLSIKWKVLFARISNLGGYFFWAIGYDKDWALSRQASKAWDY